MLRVGELTEAAMRGQVAGAECQPHTWRRPSVSRVRVQASPASKRGHSGQWGLQASQAHQELWQAGRGGARLGSRGWASVGSVRLHGSAISPGSMCQENEVL